MDFSFSFLQRKPDIESMRDRQDITGLMKALNHRDPDVQWRAAEALGKLGEPALEHLHAGMLHASIAVRLGIIEALGDIRNPRSIPLLIHTLNADKSHEVRWAAALVLGDMGDTRAIPSLFAALRDTDKYVRYGAAVSLERLHWKPATAEERALLYLGKNEWDALASMGRSAMSTLNFAMQDRDPEVRVHVVEILGGIEDEGARKTCRTALADGNADVRWTAVLSSLRCQVSAMQLPRWVAKRPRVRKSPRVAAFLNLILPGIGYTYLGKWWGFMLWQILIVTALIVFLFAGGVNTNYSVLSAFYMYPLYVAMSIHAYFLAKRMPEM